MAALTITMHTDDQVVRTACVDTANQVVAALAAKYGFDAEEALREFNLTEIKIKRGAPIKAKKPVKKKTKDAEGKPKAKRAPTGYILYQKAERESVVGALQAEAEEAAEEGGEPAAKVMPTAVITALAARWKGESQEVRDGYNAEAKALKADSEASTGDDE